MKKVLVIAGTRPEAIKMAPVVHALRGIENFDTRLVSTGQHREMLKQAFGDFVPDAELDVMTPQQTLASLSGRLFEALDALLARENPDAVLIEGDTTTVEVAALCAFYRGIPVGHVEAGLRSHDMRAPFPEELNRRIATLASTWHFAPTEAARRNLEAEGIAPDSICVCGNTVVDALLYMRDRVRHAPLPPRIEDAIRSGRRIVLITGHRRESFGIGFQDICEALAQLAGAHGDVVFVYPVHLNPQVRGPVQARLGGIKNVILEEPLAYGPFVRLMDSSRLILTDSGGIQEEAPSLKIPVLVMRTVTERPEGIAAGVSRLVGTEPKRIVAGVEEILFDDTAWNAMRAADNPYGDGKAARRIVDHLAHWERRRPAGSRASSAQRA